MRRLDAGVSGSTADMDGGAPVVGNGRWATVVRALSRGRPLRPVQRLALEEARVHESRQHFVVAAPTNSGKSLIGHLVLVDALLQGKRAVLVEPLRALAQEQADELSELLPGLAPAVVPRTPKVRISTGDYRLDGELPASAPPEEGEVIVATPERLDAILRNPAHAPWAVSIGALVIDEAHLLGDGRRGPTLELLVASMLSMSSPPRLALLSATVGEPERLREWLKPCQLVTSTARTPLTKEVWQLDDGENPDDLLVDELRSVLVDATAAALVFVYRRDAAESLARRLTSSHGTPAFPYHSGQSAAERLRIRESFRAGTCRCLVATTALAMGVNLPATHVYVRDTTFHGFGKLRTDELLQILGRAGRGDRAGLGVVMVRPHDEWNPEELARALREESLPALKSSFEVVANGDRRQRSDVRSEVDFAAAGLVATVLGRASEEGVTAQHVSSLLEHTLGGQALASRVDGAVRWLTDPSRVIAYRDEQQRLHLTVLGLAGVRSMLPLGYVAGLGQLVRDLISLDTTAKLLSRWSPLDHLFAVSLLSDRAPKLRRFSEDLAGRVDGWLESRASEEKSLLFAEWVMGSADASKADEVFGSLGISDAKQGGGGARKRAYVAMLAAIVLDERSRGVSVADIESRWSVSGLEGIEEAWRDSALWLLAGHTSIFEIRAFYHHLLQHCSATPEQVRETKRTLGRIRGQAYDLLERLKYCSPLGPLMRGVRDVLRASKEPTLGVGTIRKLEGAGVTSLQQLAQMDLDAIVAAGVQKRFAKQIKTYIRRRLR